MCLFCVLYHSYAVTMILQRSTSWWIRSASYLILEYGPSEISWHWCWKIGAIPPLLLSCSLQCLFTVTMIHISSCFDRDSDIHPHPNYSRRGIFYAIYLGDICCILGVLVSLAASGWFWVIWFLPLSIYIG